MSSEIVIVGGGLVGCVTALSLSRHSRVSLVAPPRRVDSDGRTTALLSPSVDFLSELGVWDICGSASSPLRTIRIFDGTDRLIRSPLTEFHASDADLDSFGYNISNEVLGSALDDMISSCSSITRHETVLENIKFTDNTACLFLGSGDKLAASLVIACDGSDSLVRRECGVSVRRHDYAERALVVNFGHTLPHNDSSLEIHTEHGPFTQVPLPPTDTSPPTTKSSQKDSRTNCSGLVWVLPFDMVPSSDDLALEIERMTQRCFGSVTLLTRPRTFELFSMTSERFSYGCCLFLGESAHRLPPIGAQGFNLSLRDIMTLTDLFPRHSIASLPEVYHRARLTDITTAVTSVDILGRSLLVDFVPLHLLRALGLITVGRIDWLRRLLVRRGLGFSQ